MKKHLLTLVMLSLLLTGCSTPTSDSKSEYDEVDLIKYEKCLEGASQAFIAVLERSDKRGVYDYSKSVNYCEYWKPVKK